MELTEEMIEIIKMSSTLGAFLGVIISYAIDILVGLISCAINKFKKRG